MDAALDETFRFARARALVTSLLALRVFLAGQKKKCVAISVPKSAALPGLLWGYGAALGDPGSVTVHPSDRIARHDRHRAGGAPHCENEGVDCDYDGVWRNGLRWA